MEKPVVIAANKADVLASQNNLEKIMEKYTHVIPCTSELEVLLRKLQRMGSYIIFQETIHSKLKKICN